MGIACWLKCWLVYNKLGWMLGFTAFLTINLKRVAVLPHVPRCYHNTSSHSRRFKWVARRSLDTAWRLCVGAASVSIIWGIQAVERESRNLSADRVYRGWRRLSKWASWLEVSFATSTMILKASNLQLHHIQSGSHFIARFGGVSGSSITHIRTVDML